MIKKDDLKKSPTQYKNLIKDLKIDKPDMVWCTDFTYIKYRSKFIYLATIIDLFSREVVGHNVSRFHNRFLVTGAYEDALSKSKAPNITHSDQGSEYDSFDFISIVEKSGSKVSMSTKGSPWENGYQESFFGKLKVELGDPNRFETIGELLEEIYKMIYYYNNKRIHTKLKMTPFEFRQQYLNKDINTPS